MREREGRRGAVIDLPSDAEENGASEIYGRSAAFQARTPPEPPWLVPIKINNASIYKSQIPPQSPAAPVPNHRQNTAREDDAEEERER